MTVKSLLQRPGTLSLGRILELAGNMNQMLRSVELSILVSYLAGPEVSNPATFGVLQALSI